MTTGRAHWTQSRGRGSVLAINRGVWFTLKTSLGKPLLSHFASIPPPPLQHQHPPPSSIFHL
ncbi:hypothetical protein Hdeb2414_s0006g00196291 [Helianthus debilis subsp. tardiflorus]